MASFAKRSSLDFKRVLPKIRSREGVKTNSEYADCLILLFGVIIFFAQLIAARFLFKL